MWARQIDKLGHVLLNTSAIRKKDQKCPIARHFSEMSHSVSELNFVAIEQITQSRRGGNMQRRLLQGQCKWIFYLRCIYSLGMKSSFLNVFCECLFIYIHMHF